MLQFHPSHPMRPPTWRWEYARIIRETKARGLLKNTADPWVRMTHGFQVGLSKCSDDIDRYSLMEEYPDLYGAYLIYQRGENEERHPLRFALEARILADQTAADIAGRLGVSTELINAYENVFFNVKDKLHNMDYIMTCVMSSSVHAGLSDRDYDLLWKLFGYLYGPIVLDAFIHTTTRRYRPETLSEVDAALAEDTRASLQRKVAVVSRTYVVNAFSQSELLNLYARLLEMEKEVGGERNRDVILQNVQVMLQKLPFVPPDDLLQQPQPALLDHYDSTAAELKTDELLDVTLSNNEPGNNEINSLKFPELVNATKPIK